MGESIKKELSDEELSNVSGGGGASVNYVLSCFDGDPGCDFEEVCRSERIAEKQFRYTYNGKCPKCQTGRLRIRER